MVDIVDRIQRGFEDKDYLIGNWLARSELVLLFASRGVGKTYISLLLAHSLASGNDFLGHPTNRVRVIYFDGEMGSEALARRVQKIDNNPSTEKGLVKGWLSTQCLDECENHVMWNLADPTVQNLYNSRIKKSNADVVVIDNINTCSTAINSRDSDFSIWERIQAWAVKKRQEGLTVIFIHHAGKSGEQLGTSQRENIMDYVIQLKASRIKPAVGFTNFEWIFTKTRDVAKDEVPNKYVEFQVVDNQFTISHINLEDKKSEEAKHLMNSGMTKAEVADKLGLPKWKVSELAEKVFTPDDAEHWQEEDDEDRYF